MLALQVLGYWIFAGPIPFDMEGPVTNDGHQPCPRGQRKDRDMAAPQKVGSLKGARGARGASCSDIFAAVWGLSAVSVSEAQVGHMCSAGAMGQSSKPSAMPREHVSMQLKQASSLSMPIQP